MASTHTHTAIATTAKGVVDVLRVQTQKPQQGEVLIKVAYASLIAPDTYMADSGLFVDKYPVILGFNASGIVVEVGPDTPGLAVDDRVVAFTYQSPQSKALQEYTVVSHTVCAKIPDSLELDVATTIPDNFVCAFYTLFDGLKLPLPTAFPASVPPPHADTPILIHGAGATSGQYAIQLLKLAGYKRIIATASPQHHEYLRSLGATHVLDYSSPSLQVELLQKAGESIQMALDCITSEGTLAIISQFLSPDGTVALLLPIKQGDSVTGPPGSQMFMELSEEKNPFPKTVTVIGIRTFFYQTNEHLKENLMPKILPKLLADGLIQPNRVRLLDQGGLKERVEQGMDLLRRNKVKGEKIVVKID